MVRTVGNRRFKWSCWRMAAGRSPAWEWPGPNGKRMRQTSPRRIGPTFRFLAVIDHSIDEVPRLSPEELPTEQLLAEFRVEVVHRDRDDEDLHARAFRERAVRLDPPVFDN